jgi:hypothetical protein
VCGSVYGRGFTCVRSFWVRVCVHLCAYALGACACTQGVRVCPCSRAFVCAHVRMFVHFHRIASSHASVFRRVCAPPRCAGILVAPRGVAGLIARRATRGRLRLRACVCAIGRSPAFAAGVTWTSRTMIAPWGDRAAHTSVIDAAGAIYVIGGRGGGTAYLSDVWASTDGGARPDSRGG